MKTNTAQPELSAAMRDAVERLYSVFKPYAAPQHMLDVCTHCCMDAALEVEMRRLPLRQLTAKHFYEYNTSAKGAEQPVNEIKYLLPRMLELLALDADLHHSIELSLQRLGNCHDGAIFPDELTAIHAFARCYFAERLGQHAWQAPSEAMQSDPLELLLMFYIGGLEITALLDQWLVDERPTAALHYVDTTYRNFWRSCEIENAFATERPRYRQQMSDWILDAGNRACFAKRIVEIDREALRGRGEFNCGGNLSPNDLLDFVFDLMTN
jgi:hypothetical protein